MTFLADERGLVLVDGGGVGSGRLIRAGLRRAGYAVSDIRLAAVTHYHPDHTGGLSALSAPVAAHEDDAAIISREAPYPSPFDRSALGRAAWPLTRPVLGEGVPVAHRLRDGDRLPGAEGVVVVHTPGHTAGSVCLYVESKKLIIVGDALRHRGGSLWHRGGGLIPPPRLVTQDLDLAVESLRKLTALDFETICFSHFPPMRERARESLELLLEGYGKGCGGGSGGF